ncbi:glycoside hydrolase family 32 protein [Leuconostoc citreum]|uniref:glycoside hydrolase family 32 protein n=1 Tax=Leuconostoc citreum TaxID=33964 RepID=UPI000BFF1297|nr:glycoside hydrolase family 32 protein [Leuconostoc citreum]
MHKQLLICAGILAGLAIGVSSASADTNALSSGEHAQNIHINTDDGWSNDVQNIVWNETGQYYDVYFLHSADGADNPFGPKGQDWYHTTTKDFVHYTKQNSAIPSFGPDAPFTWKSAWTGSIVTNQGNIQGVPKGAKVAYFSGLEKNDGGSQNIWAAWSSDNGKTFSHVLNNANPVIDHSWDWTAANHADERDSSVFYKDGEMFMYTSEGQEIGVYKSKDGLKWEKADANGESKVKPYTFFAGHSWDGNAPIECPAIRTMKMPNGQTKQVMFFGAKDASNQESTGTYYVVGHLDKNGLFVNETEAKLVDQGTDFYGANVTGSDDIHTVNHSVKALAWVGNWNYTASGIRSDQNGKSPLTKHLGAYSSMRELTLNNDLTLHQKTDIGEKDVKSSKTVEATTNKPINSGKAPFSIGKDTNGDIYNLVDKANDDASQVYNLEFSKKDLKQYNGRIYIDIWQGKDNVRFNFDPTNGFYNVKSFASELSHGAFDYYKNGLLGNGNGYVRQSGYLPKDKVEIKVVTDKSSVEFFFPNGQSYTISRFATSDKQDFKVFTEDSNLTQSTKTLKMTQKTLN